MCSLGVTTLNFLKKVITLIPVVLACKQNVLNKHNYFGCQSIKHTLTQCYKILHMWKYFSFIWSYRCCLLVTFLASKCYPYLQHRQYFLSRDTIFSECNSVVIFSHATNIINVLSFQEWGCGLIRSKKRLTSDHEIWFIGPN